MSEVKRSTTEPTGSLAPFKPLPFHPASVSIERRDDGSILLRSGHDDGMAPRSIPHLMAERAGQFPDRDFIMQRRTEDGPWEGFTYAEGHNQSQRVAQWLLNQGLGADDVLMVLSGNSLEQAILMLGCYTAGVPIAPVSVGFSQASQNFSKLLHCFDVLQPRLVFVQSMAPFAAALDALRAASPELRIISANAEDGTIPFSALTETPPTQDVARLREQLTPASVAKYLFTSGSTGVPKCVIQTHGMMTAGIASTEGLMVSTAPRDVAPMYLEWMPWSHISAGNVSFNQLMWDAGTIFLDDGRPTRDRFHLTIKNLYDVSPKKFGSAPIAFAMLADAMERDEALRHSFFKNLDYMAYGGATLSNDVYERIQALAVAETGFRVPLLTSFGATETQQVTFVYWPVERAGLIGLPLAGVTIKLVPNGAKLEVRVKGATVTPGYYKDEQNTTAAFDEEGFYRLGDAARFVDQSDPTAGLLFDGRVTEDFKLNTSTWVSVGTLRPDVIAACSPLVADLVLTGQDQGFVGAMLWPTAAAIADHGSIEAVTKLIAARLAEFNKAAGGGSRRIGRFIVLTDPPSMDAGEMTDKGYVNQRAVAANRKALVDLLYADPLGAGVTQV